MIEMCFSEPTIEDRGYCLEVVSDPEFDFPAQKETVKDDGWFRGVDTRYLHIDNGTDSILEIYASSTPPIIAHGTIVIDDDAVLDVLAGKVDGMDELSENGRHAAVSFARLLEDRLTHEEPDHLRLLRGMRRVFGDYWVEQGSGLHGLDAAQAFRSSFGGRVAPDIDLVFIDEIPPFHVAHTRTSRFLHCARKPKAEEPTTRYFGRRNLDLSS